MTISLPVDRHMFRALEHVGWQHGAPTYSRSFTHLRLGLSNHRSGRRLDML
jgi:hypothetical protein